MSFRIQFSMLILAVTLMPAGRVHAIVKTGQPAPAITSKTLDGRPFRLSDYRGKVVLLDFWMVEFRPERFMREGDPGGDYGEHE